MTVIRFLAIFLILQISVMAQETHTYVGHYSYPSSGPQVYKDPKTGTLLYLETDGRHLAAISSEGKLLWTRDPFCGAHVPFYRFKNPKVVTIKAVSPASDPQEGEPDTFVSIFLANSQFGWLRSAMENFGSEDRIRAHILCRCTLPTTTTVVGGERRLGKHLQTMLLHDHEQLNSHAAGLLHSGFPLFDG